MKIKYSKVTVQPTEEPVSLDEAKAHCRVSGTGDDVYLTTLIKVARILCESYSGLSFLTQTRVIKLDAFPCSGLPIEIPYGPVQSVEEFTYIDSDEVTQTLVEDTDFVVDSHSDLTKLVAEDSWPGTFNKPNAVSIETICGYATAADVPEQIKQAILMQIGSMYENRQDEIYGTISMITMNSRMLLDTVKVYWNAEQD